MATIFLTPVEDPRRYGLVEVRPDASVSSFTEKPGNEHSGGGLINAGVYVLESPVLEMIPAGRMFSIERGVFPKLAQAGSLFAFVGDGYWRDIGTPESYLQAHFDILEGALETAVADELGPDYLHVSSSARVAATARIVPPSYVADGAEVGDGAQVGPLAVVGTGAAVGEGATIVESVLQAGVHVGAHASVERSVLVRDSWVGAGTQVSHAILGEGCRVGAGNRLANGICLHPGVELPDNSVQFRDAEQGGEGR
jgi:mannose-1-phosphate guanylyltransferase